MAGRRWGDLWRYLVHVGFDFFFLAGCYSCDYFKECFCVTCDHACTKGSCNSTHASCVWNDNAFYIFDYISAYFNIQLIGQMTQGFPCHSACIGNGDWFGAPHSRDQLFFQDFYVSLVFFITFVQCFFLAFAQQYECYYSLCKQQ